MVQVLGSHRIPQLSSWISFVLNEPNLNCKKEAGSRGATGTGKTRPYLKKYKPSKTFLQSRDTQGKRQPGKTDNSYILTILRSQLPHENWKPHNSLSQQRESWAPRLLVSPVCNGHSMLFTLPVPLTSHSGVRAV